MPERSAVEPRRPTPRSHSLVSGAGFAASYRPSASLPPRERSATRREAESEHVRAAEVGGIRHGEEASETHR